LATYATAPTAFDITGSKFASVTSLQLDDLGGGANTIAWIKLAHQSLTISGDSGYGGNIFIIQSAVDTSENVTFSGAGKSTVHDLVAVAGTNAAGSADTGFDNLLDRRREFRRLRQLRLQ